MVPHFEIGRASDEKESGYINRNRECPDGDGLQLGGLKSCSDCRTTKTPLWRIGPSGPKSLCNACGIRYRKKRRELLVSKEEGMVDKERKDMKEEKERIGALRWMGFGRDHMLLKQRSLHRVKRSRRLAEEEEAAVLLMALSCGFLYARSRTSQ